MNSEMVLYDSPEAAKFVDGHSGWVSRDGRFFGDNEHLARYCGCTHVKCETCGHIHACNSYCEPCAERRRDERFNGYERKEWDGETPLNISGTDQYFFDYDDLQNWLEDNDEALEDLQLVLCKPVTMNQLDEDYFLENLHEDAEIPEQLQDAIDHLNEVVRSLPTQCWEPDKFAAVVNL
jgi:hypothetical protein